MKDFLSKLDSTEKVVLILALLITLIVTFVVLILNVTKSIDIYLLRDNAQAVALYLTKGK